jgi:hypothetical protein
MEPATALVLQSVQSGQHTVNLFELKRIIFVSETKRALIYKEINCWHHK